MALGEYFQLRQGRVAGDHDNGVGGAVPASVKGECVFAGQGADFVEPTDDRRAVTVVEVERRVDLFGKPRFGVAVGALAPLLDDDIAFGQYVGFGEHEVGHAVRFERHDSFKVLRRYRFEVAGVVVRGKRVQLSAESLHGARESVARIVGCALEHEVLEQVGDAGFARRLIG